jgi:hypothetical protein
MTRRLLNFLTLLSLLLCVAVVALWVRSYWAWDSWEIATPFDTDLTAQTTRPGSVDLFRHHHAHFRHISASTWGAEGTNTFDVPGVLGFATGRLGAWRFIKVPFWFPTACTLVLPLSRLVRTLTRRRRYASGRCASCGYDLRATPDRCPECGHTPAGAIA